ncbi:MAG: hypothetical protein H6711_34970 [Myxococcales bacterium]|nr:hypothetical protein [Myxococcales bacterium]
MGQIGTGLHEPKAITEVALTDAEADLEVRGQVHRAAVWRELQAHRVDIEACCRDLLGRDLSGGGQAKIAFVIGKGGEATNLHVSELDDASGSPHPDARPALAACIGKAAAAWAFPPPTAGLATVAYRIGFAPAP